MYYICITRKELNMKVLSFLILLSIGFSQTYNTYDYGTNSSSTTTLNGNTATTYDYGTSSYKTTTKSGNTFNTYDYGTNSSKTTTKTSSIWDD